MTIARLIVAATLAATFAATPALAPAQTASPSPGPQRTIPPLHLPTHKLHSEYVVEVNKKGQVVKIKSGVGTNIPAYNIMTFGNALQMWIRHPDGTADVGLFKVSYDYDPATKKTTRTVALIKLGGDWGDKMGAATAMSMTAEKEYEAWKKAQSGQDLPSLHDITGKPTPVPTATVPPPP